MSSYFIFFATLDSHVATFVAPLNDKWNIPQLRQRRNITFGASQKYHSRKARISLRQRRNITFGTSQKYHSRKREYHCAKAQYHFWRKPKISLSQSENITAPKAQYHPASVGRVISISLLGRRFRREWRDCRL